MWPPHQAGAHERVALLLDADSFEELDGAMRSGDPLRFAPEGIQPLPGQAGVPGQGDGLREAAIYGRGRLEGHPVALAIMLSFLRGLHGLRGGGRSPAPASWPCRAPAHRLLRLRGARQHEGIIALMQMAKTVVAVQALGRAGIPYISIMTDPTTAGVTASFAALGDCVIAEPGAVIGFAGRRVVEQTVREKLPAWARPSSSCSTG